MRFNKKLLLPVLILVILAVSVSAQYGFGDMMEGISNIGPNLQDSIFVPTFFSIGLAIFIFTSRYKLLGEGMGLLGTGLLTLFLAYFITSVRLGPNSTLASGYIYFLIIILTIALKTSNKDGHVNAGATTLQSMVIYGIPSALVAPFWSMATGSDPLGSFAAHLGIAFVIGVTINLVKANKEKNKNKQGETIRGALKGKVIDWIKGSKDEDKNLKKEKKGVDEGVEDDKKTAEDLDKVSDKIEDTLEKPTPENKEELVKQLVEAVSIETERKKDIKLEETDLEKNYKRSKSSIEYKKSALKTLQDKRAYLIGTPSGRIAAYLVRLRKSLFTKVGEEVYDKELGKKTTKAINWNFWHRFAGKNWDNPTQFIKEIEEISKDKDFSQPIIDDYKELLLKKSTPIDINDKLIRLYIKKVAHERRLYIKTLEGNLPGSIKKHTKVVNDCKRVDELQNIINKQRKQINRNKSQIGQLSKKVEEYSKVLLRKDTSPEYDKKLMETLGKYILFIDRLVEGNYKTGEIEYHNLDRLIGYNKKANDSIIEAYRHDDVDVDQVLGAVLGVEGAIYTMTGAMPRGVPTGAKWSEVKT